MGYGLVLDVLKDEMSDLLDSVHFELRLFFAVYSILLVFGSDPLSRSKVDGFVPCIQRVNLRIVGQLSRGLQHAPCLRVAPSFLTNPPDQPSQPILLSDSPHQPFQANPLIIPAYRPS